ncbi:MAG TPA: C40 family peptidase [Methylomirabilota bacterium]|nr:C40 family peptidase [Methylomirabilota bacterium]
MSAPIRTISLLGLLLLATACSKALLAPEPGVPGIATDRAEPSRNAAAARMATRYLGTPYARAGSSPGGFDCSGLVRHVFAKVGVALPHNAAQQFRFGAPVELGGLVPGDVVFFDRLRHNGIYLGDGRFVHATHPGGVKIARLDNEWFRSRWVGARRF